MKQRSISKKEKIGTEKALQEKVVDKLFRMSKLLTKQEIKLLCGVANKHHKLNKNLRGFHKIT